MKGTFEPQPQSVKSHGRSSIEVKAKSENTTYEVGNLQPADTARLANRTRPFGSTAPTARRLRPGIRREIFSNILSERGDRSIISHRFPENHNPPPRKPALTRITFEYQPYIVVVGGEDNSSAFGLSATSGKSCRASQKCSQCSYCPGNAKRMLQHLVLHRGSVQCPWNNVVGPEACTARKLKNPRPTLYFRWDKLEEFVRPAALGDLQND